MTCNTSDYPIRDILRQFSDEYGKSHHLSAEEYKVINLIKRCKTGELGYNASICEDCGQIQLHASSCNNRNCPCCQAPLEKKWELERHTELIDGIAYYHVIFTMPHELNDLVRANPKPLLNLLFKSAQDTLLTLCADKRFLGAKPGIISVLHTWGQKLNFHPHLHICLSGGGLNPAGQFVVTRRKGFFIPVGVIAKMFRGKYLAGLKHLYDSDELVMSDTPDLDEYPLWKEFIDKLYKKQWLPFIKETFNGNGNAISYLARYSFRTAIANSRIVSFDEKIVTFKYKDYADKNTEKLMTVSGTEFIRLFLLHILPKGFNRMRFSGYLTNSRKTKNLKHIHRMRCSVYPGNPYRGIKVAELMMTLYNRDICKCPGCSGHLIVLSRRPPDSLLPKIMEGMSNVAI